MINCQLESKERLIKMKAEYHLDLTDIQKAIAEKYGVSPDCVEIRCYLEDVGYGLAERKEPSVKAIIKTN